MVDSEEGTIECRMLWVVRAFEGKNCKSKETGGNAFGELQQEKERYSK